MPANSSSCSSAVKALLCTCLCCPAGQDSDLPRMILSVSGHQLQLSEHGLTIMSDKRTDLPSL